ncbi:MULTISPECIES: zinc-dependent alcohol dehydrogenase family protein [Flavobacteriaceae]|uniref:Zinc-dependent alcohol dehydrogenase family protein n=2 Tax=Flagellimonas TaxID=444459 RepID=A0ABT5XRQ2_9FLAO|nr:MULTISPECIES: zinc-dependent alcohol dehydrogenase family protein [Flavobacteriaceae]MBO0356186.1 zinc-dependent alcohol dehydrogenase family protein [Allomuricauda aurea]MDF0708565.1 zinc-dependent alcohol dehydrogenase family protein [[Muricauda] okinawensis]
MKAIRFHKIGGPEVLQFDNVDIQQPKNDEVLFKVEAFSLNQADILFINGMHYTQPIFPSRIGSEATGEVVEVGPNVTKFKKGDKVTSIPFYTQKYGVQGEYATVPEMYLTKVPDNYEVEEATSFWMQYLTAYYALFKLGNVKKGDCVFIPATSGTAGQGALKLAKDAGAIVIGSTRTQAKKKFLYELGTDHVIVTNEENTNEKLKEIVRDQGIKFSFDPIGNTEFIKQYMPLLSFGGSAAIYGLLSGEFPTFPLLDLVRNNATLYAYSLFNHVIDRKELKEGTDYVLKRIKEGRLKPLVDKVFDFQDTVEAYQYMLSNKQKGKIVIKV